VGYRRSLLARWSRRDRLAVAVVALTVAFLTGATLLLFAAGAQTTAIAAGYDSTGAATMHDSPADARATDPETVVPVGTVQRENGPTAVVSGVPPGADGAFGRGGTTLDDGRNGTTLGTIDGPRTETLAGQRERVTVAVQPRPPRATLLPPTWYVTNPSTVERFGTTGAVAISRTDGPPSQGVPLLGALPFFVVGTRQAVAALGAATIAGGFLVAVTVYSVTGMTVRDRLSTIRVVRATGGTRAGVLGVFALRAALVTAVGVAAGYAVGVIATRGAVNLAVTLGLPTSLDVSVTPATVEVLAPTYLLLVAVGALAGAVAAWPTVSRPVAPLARSGVDARRWPAPTARRSRNQAAPTPSGVPSRPATPTRSAGRASTRARRCSSSRWSTASRSSPAGPASTRSPASPTPRSSGGDSRPTGTRASSDGTSPDRSTSAWATRSSSAGAPAQP